MAAPSPEALAAVPLFASLSAPQLQALASWFEVEEYAAGQVPTRAGSSGYAFFVLGEGRAHAELGGRTLEQLEPGAVFGEMAFFTDSGRRTADVVADTPITVFAMFGTRFREMQAQLPEVAAKLQELFDVRAAREQAADGD